MHSFPLLGSFFGLLGVLWMLALAVAVVGVIRMSFVTLPAVHEEVKLLRQKVSELEEQQRNRV